MVNDARWIELPDVTSISVSHIISDLADKGLRPNIDYEFQFLPAWANEQQGGSGRCVRFLFYESSMASWFLLTWRKDEPDDI